MGSSSLTRERTHAPCIGSIESWPLNHQGSPWTHFYFTRALFLFSGYSFLVAFCFFFISWMGYIFIFLFVLVSFCHVHIFLKWLVILGSPFTPTVEAGKTCFGISVLQDWSPRGLHCEVSGGVAVLCEIFVSRHFWVFSLGWFVFWKKSCRTGVRLAAPVLGVSSGRGRVGWGFWPVICVTLLNFLVSSLYLTILCVVSDISFCCWFFQKIQPLVCCRGFLGKPQSSFSCTFSLLARSALHFWSPSVCGIFPCQAGLCDSPQVSCDLIYL